MNPEPVENKSPRRWRVSRRGFLIGLGATGGLLALGWGFGLPALRLKMAELFDSGEGAGGEIDTTPTTWFEIATDNTVTLRLPKVEMGQGIHTALSQIAAEELDIAWEQLRVVSADTLAGPIDDFGTAGSMSVMTMWMPLRQAAATMRLMLVEEAARQLSVSASELVVENGRVSVQNNPDQTLTYGEIVQAADGTWEVPEEPPVLKTPDQFKIIGQPMPRVDLPDKLTGQAFYGLDVRMEGMLYGATAYSATVAGKLLQAAPGEAANQPGVVQVVIEDEFAGVVATSRAEAEAALGSLDITWDEGPLLNMDDITAIVTVGEGDATVIQKEGDAADVLKAASGEHGPLIMAEYRTPLAAHAHLEPQAALVFVNDDKVEAWVATQMPRLVQESLAEALERPMEEIKVTATYLGGGFGRKAGTEAAVEAARLSRAAGKPVHVGWTRPKEFRAGYLRPPTHHLLRGLVTADGRIHAYDHQQASGDVAFLFVPAVFALAAGADFGATRGARFMYAAPHVRTVAWRTPLPFPTGWWRGLGLLANTFAIESFMDEMAAAAAVDPLEFRLRHLPQNERGRRLGRVLEAVAEMAGWGTAVPADRALGLAACMDANTAVAQVAEVFLEADKPRVHKVSCAIDPGLPINPDGVRAQTEGAIVMGLSSTFFEQITVAEGRITNTNFDSYPLITMKETPEIEVQVIRSGDEPYGMGEPPIGPVAAAVANAIFRLTGVRLRELPLQWP